MVKQLDWDVTGLDDQERARFLRLMELGDKLEEARHRRALGASVPAPPTGYNPRMLAMRLINRGERRRRQAI